MNLTKVMVMVTACFITCWVPSNGYYLLFNMGVNNLGFSHPLYYIFLFMVFLNSCINPVIYVWKLTTFRETLSRMVPCVGRRIGAGESGSGADTSYRYKGRSTHVASTMAI